MVPLQYLDTYDLARLKAAKEAMENLHWAMLGLSKIGNMIESRLALLPQKQQRWLQELSYKVLQKVVAANLLSMKKDTIGTRPWNNTYKALVTSTGMVGGALGVTAFAVDLTVTTKLMMRSIMDIARSEGEDLMELDTQLACLQVFALGGKSKHDDGMETGYYASRFAASSTLKGGIKALEGVLRGSSNPILQSLAMIASRFSVQVSEKFVAQAIPVIGAAGGGAINLAFMHHFQEMAKAHFAIRALERKYGPEMIRREYERL